MKDKLINNLISEVGFDYDDSQKIYYSKPITWQHNLGYFTLYDYAAPFTSMFIHCEPVLFDYDNRKWKIEFWKGQYGISTGAEVGIYTGKFKTGNELIDHTLNRLEAADTNCPEEKDWLQMSFILKKGNTEIFRRDSTVFGSKDGKHWWLTGFKPGINHRAEELVCDITIHFKDELMAQAFVAGLKGKDLKYDESEFERNGSVVTVIFGTPHSPQPLSLYPEGVKRTQEAILAYMSKVYLKIEDYTIENIVHFLTERYNMGREDVVEFLKDAGFSLDKIGTYFYDAFNKNAAKMIKLLLAADFTRKEVFNFVKDHINASNEKLFELFDNAGYELKKLERWFNLSDAAFAKLLHDQGHSLNEIGNFYKKELDKNAGQVLLILNKTGFGKDAVMKFVENSFRLNWFDIAQLWLSKIGK